jgi:hypothetical protein
MLKPLFVWLDQHPPIYWVIVALPTVFFVIWTLFPIFRRSRSDPTQRADRWLLATGLIGLFLFAWRWPWLLSAEDLGPDESQHVAGVLTLARDPLFFRSVDGSTAGPLNFYAPLPIGWLTGHIDYFTVRLTGLLLVWGALVASYRSLRQLTEPAVARIGLFGVTLFFAATTDSDFLHYTTEHVPIFLFAVTFWLLVRAHHAEKPLGWFIAAGFVAGLSPWGKLQIGPVTAGLVIGSLALIARGSDAPRTKWRHALALSLTTLAPTGIAIALLAPEGLVGLAFKRYVLQNFSYVGSGEQTGLTLSNFWRLTSDSGWFPAFAVGPALLVLAAGVVSILQRRPWSRAYFAAGALTVVALICALLPGRPFRHYLLIVVLPLGFWAVVALHQLVTSFVHPRLRLALALAGLALVSGPLVKLRLAEPPPFMFGLFTEHWRYPRSAPANIVRALTRPGDTLGLWGYAPAIYAETGLPHATRDSDTFWSIQPSAARDEYRAIFLEDLKRARPAVFLGAVGPGSPYYQDREQLGYTSFPALGAYVDANYVQVADIAEFRIFLRQDLLKERPLTQADITEAWARARPALPRDVPLQTFVEQAKLIRLGDQFITKILPPNQLTVPLAGTEREVTFEYGFHPDAVAANGSNGATFVLELVNDRDAPRPVFRRFVDPVRVPGDRQRLKATAALPPSTAGWNLRIRTEAGPYNDDAWDWLYLASLKFRHSIGLDRAQFPHFNRLPARLTASTIYHMDTARGRRLMAHAPARFEFPLHGRERSLDFTFGLRANAYSGSGRSSGAIFRVKRQRADHAPVVLFERNLDPRQDEADRGAQLAHLELRGQRADDTLVIEIDPGANPSWDWTYVTDLVLR